MQFYFTVQNVPDVIRNKTLIMKHTHVCTAGGHPSVKDGEVTRTINFHWTMSESQWSTTAQVVNCGRFFVYQLKESPVCSGVYCGEDVEGLNSKGQNNINQVMEVI